MYLSFMWYSITFLLRNLIKIYLDTILKNNLNYFYKISLQMMIILIYLIYNLCKILKK